MKINYTQQHSATQSTIINFNRQISGGIHLYNGFWPSHILKTNSIANFITQLCIHLLANSLGNTHSCHTPWLGAAYYPIYSIAILMQILSNKSNVKTHFDIYRYLFFLSFLTGKYNNVHNKSKVKERGDRTTKPVSIALSFLNQSLQPRSPPDFHESPTHCVSRNQEIITITYMSQNLHVLDRKSKRKQYC